MNLPQRPPAGPRAVVGTAAESAAAAHLVRAGWTVLGRNVRIGRDEVDILAREPGPAGALVVVEVRARSRPGFGEAAESVDRHKVSRLYRAAWALRRAGHPAIVRAGGPGTVWRVDLITLVRSPAGAWRIERHVRGLEPP